MARLGRLGRVRLEAEKDVDSLPGRLPESDQERQARAAIGRAKHLGEMPLGDPERLRGLRLAAFVLVLDEPAHERGHARNAPRIDTLRPTHERDRMTLGHCYGKHRVLTLEVFIAIAKNMITNGEALFLWREKQGYSQTEAAEKLSPPVQQGTWAAWEAGRAPDLHNALQLDTLTAGEVKAANWPRAKTTRRRVKLGGKRRAAVGT